MAESVIDTILRLSPDKNALKASVAGAEQLTAVLEQTRKRTVSVDAAAEGLNKELANIARNRAIEQLSSELAEGVRQGGRFNDELFVASKTLSALGASEDEIRGVARALADAAENAERLDRAGTGGGGGGGGRFDAIDRTGAVGSQILSGLGQGEAANLAGLIGDTAGALTSLNPAMLAVTAAGIGLTAVLGDIQRGIEGAKEAGDEYAQKLLTNADLVLSGATTEEVTAMRDQAQEFFDIFSARSEELSELRRQLADETRGVPSFANVSDTTAQPILDRFEEITGITVTSLDQMTTAIEGTQTLTNQYGSKLLDLNQLLVSGALMVNDAAKAERERTEYLEEYNRQLEQTAEEGERAWREYHALVVRDVARQQELIAQGITAQYDAQLDTLTRLGQAQEDVNKAQQAYNQTLSQSEARLTEINDRLNEQLANAESNRLEALNAAEVRAGEERLKALETFREQEARINKRFQTDYLSAVGERDAQAAYQAKLAREEQLQEQEQQLSKQEQTIERELRKQREAAENSYRKQAETARDAANKAIQLEVNRRNTELQIRQQTLDVALTQLRNFQSAAIAIMQQLVTTTANMQGGANYGTPVQVPLPGGGSQPGWAVPVNPIYPGQPGYVQQYAAPQQGGGGLTVAPTYNLSGQTRQQVEAQLAQSNRELVNQIWGSSAPR